MMPSRFIMPAAGGIGLTVFFRLLSAPGAEPGTIADYRILGLPTKHLIDKQGVVRRKYLSDAPVSEVEADILDRLKRDSGKIS